MRFCWAFYAVAGAIPLAVVSCGDSEEGTFTPPEPPAQCTAAAIVSPADGQFLRDELDSDRDCSNGIQLEVIVATNAPDGTEAHLSVEGQRVATAVTSGATVRFSNVKLSATGKQELGVEVGGSSGCEATATVTGACEGPPSCRIISPVITEAHPELNNVPAPNGDRVSDPEQPYKVEFRVLTSAEEGQVVTLNVNQGQSIAAATAVEGLAIFPPVALVDGQHSVYASCTAANGASKNSENAEYAVDTTAPGLVVVEPEWGQTLGPTDDVNDSVAGIQFRVCATTTSEDALELAEILEAPHNNLCVYFDDDESPASCVPATLRGVDSERDGACLTLNCPDDQYFNLTATLTDDAGNLNEYQVYGLRCDPTR